MEKTLTLKDRTLRFEYHEPGNSWHAKTTVGTLEIEIQIDPKYYRGTEINWDLIPDFFFYYISQEEMIQHLVEEVTPLMTELGKACYGETMDMEFSNTIEFNGKRANFTCYSLIFHYIKYLPGGRCDGDEYGYYKVDMENFMVRGANRSEW